MGGQSFQIIVLLVLAVVIFLRLSKELGKRDGHEPALDKRERPLKVVSDNTQVHVPDEIIEVDSNGATQAIDRAKQIEPQFRLDNFLQGSKSAYEMILMAFLNGEMSTVKSFVDAAVYEGFEDAIEARVAAGHNMEAKFLGIKDVSLKHADFDEVSKELTLGVEFISELTRAVTDAKGKVIEGSKTKAETEIDVWHFARVMGSDNPNWELVATGE